MTDHNHTQGHSLDAAQKTLARLGVAGDADWLAVLLFARNLVSAMALFTEDQKAAIQAWIVEQMGKKPLDARRFRRIVQRLEAMLLDNPQVENLRRQIKIEQESFGALCEEMGRVFSDLKASSVERETSIKRMGDDTEQLIVAADSKDEVVRRLRGLVTDMVALARQDARTWEERAKQLERTANFDTLLSELYSRRALDAQMAAAAERCTRENRELSLLFLDVDHFKTINDTYGHLVGDGVLRVLAAIVSAHAMQFGGYAARFGGEELVILCEGMNEAASLGRAEAIRLDVARCPFVPQCDGPEMVTPLQVTVSIGVAQLGPGQSTADLVLAADQAMYAAKTRGRNRVVAYSSLAAVQTT